MAEYALAEDDGFQLLEASIEGQTVFDTAIVALAEDDLAVYADGVLLDAADYAVAGYNTEAGITITLDVGLELGGELAVFRETKVKRTVDYSTRGSFRAQAVNADFDRIHLMLQERKRDAGNSLKLVRPWLDEFDAGDLPIANLGEPTEEHHAARKAEVTEVIEITAADRTAAANSASAAASSASAAADSANVAVNAAAAAAGSASYVAGALGTFEGAIDDLETGVSDLGEAVEALAPDNDPTLAGNSAVRAPSQAAVKAYSDNLVSGIKWKPPVRAATRSGVSYTLATSFQNGSELDGVTLATGDPILIKDGVAATAFGFYTVNASGAPTRTAEADSGDEMLGATAVVLEGEPTGNAPNVLKTFTCSTPGPITLGVTALAFIQSTAGTAVTQGTGITVSGQQVSVDPDYIAPGALAGASDANKEAFADGLLYQATPSSPYVSQMERVRGMGVGPDDETGGLSAAKNGTDCGAAFRSAVANGWGDGIRRFRLLSGKGRIYRISSVDPASPSGNGRNGQCVRFTGIHDEEVVLDLGGQRVICDLVGQAGMNAGVFGFRGDHITGNAWLESTTARRPSAVVQNGKIDLSASMRARAGTATQAFSAAPGGQSAFVLNSMVSGDGYNIGAADLSNLVPAIDFVVTVGGAVRDAAAKAADTITHNGAAYVYTFSAPIAAGVAVLIQRLNVGGVNGLVGFHAWSVKILGVDVTCGITAPSGRNPGVGLGGDSGYQITRPRHAFISGGQIVGCPDNGIYLTGSDAAAGSEYPGMVKIVGMTFHRCNNGINAKQLAQQHIVSYSHFRECSNAIDHTDSSAAGIISENVITRTQNRPIGVIGGAGTLVRGNKIRDWGKLLSATGTVTNAGDDAPAIFVYLHSDGKVSGNLAEMAQWAEGPDHRPCSIQNSHRITGRDNSHSGMTRGVQYRQGTTASAVLFHSENLSAGDVIDDVAITPSTGFLPVTESALAIAVGAAPVVHDVPWPGARPGGRQRWKADHTGLAAAGYWAIDARCVASNQVQVAFSRTTTATGKVPAGTVRVWPDL